MARGTDTGAGARTGGTRQGRRSAADSDWPARATIAEAHAVLGEARAAGASGGIDWQGCRSHSAPAERGGGVGVSDEGGGSATGSDWLLRLEAAHAAVAAARADFSEARARDGYSRAAERYLPAVCDRLDELLELTARAAAARAGGGAEGGYPSDGYSSDGSDGSDASVFGDDGDLDAGAQARPGPAAPAGRALRVLIVFAGPSRPHDGLAAHLRRLGAEVVEVDTKLGGDAHNVLRHRVAADIEERVRAGEFGLVFLAVPCESFSVAHRPQLRSRGRYARGLPTVVEGGALAHWVAYLGKHNRLADWALALARLAAEVGVLFIIENPSDCGDETSKAWWSRFRMHAPLWVQQAARDLRRDAGAHLYTFAQCSFGSPWRKWTSLLASPALEAALSPIRDRLCVHAALGAEAARRHESVAYGRTAAGEGRANLAAAYPAEMNLFLARAIVATLLAAPPVERGDVCGGCIVDGAALSASLAAFVESARTQTRRFASPRNLVDAACEELATEPMPVSFATPMVPTNPAKAKAPKGRPLPVEPARARTAADSAVRPAGPIHVSWLYDDGVYENEVLPWLALAGAAVADVVLHGHAPRAVPTLVVSQSRMPLWARGQVWDCRNPDDCVPVGRSDRHTVFPGEKQVDREQFRQLAAELGWHDVDIVGQVGEGGIETRTEAALDSVYSFHHKGLWAAWRQGDEAVREDIRQQWVAAPLPHPPMVPLRVLPRNMVFAERTKVNPATGALVRYMKPRVSQDSSDGHEDSINGGVPGAEKFLILPAAQQHARGAAIASTACAGGAVGLAVEGYAIDAKSAFRYCPIQLADVWTQCFIWWEWRWERGQWRLVVGICVDLRLAFGGAYSPNRFQRITCLVTAHVQSLQVAFDLAHPPPLVVQAWCAARLALQQAGRLPAGAAQTRPAGCQNFIDDTTGWALNDAVAVCGLAECVCGGACHISIDPSVMAATGGSPAAPGTRVHAHARLGVVGLRRIGLDDAPEKTVVGDPLGALGLRVNVGAWRLDCPESKGASMMADAAEQLHAARVRLRVDQRLASTLVGRFCNLTQIFPELQPFMHGGYAVVGASWSTRSRRRSQPSVLKLRAGSRARAAWCDLLEMGSALLAANEGVSLAPAAHFASRWARGSCTTTSDASGVDGVGAFVFLADWPGEVWVVAQKWPADVQAALDAAAMERAQREALPEGAPMLSMPAAELFGPILASSAAARVLAARGGSLVAVTAIGDCAPAASALNAAASPNAQMRCLLEGARELTSQWLAVAVPREANGDADRLSHPENLLSVMREAAEAGLVVHEAEAHEAAPGAAHCWRRLRSAAAIGLGELPRTRRRQRQRKRPLPLGGSPQAQVAAARRRRVHWAAELVSRVNTYNLDADEVAVKRRASGA